MASSVPSQPLVTLADSLPATTALIPTAAPPRALGELTGPHTASRGFTQPLAASHSLTHSLSRPLAASRGLARPREASHGLTWPHSLTWPHAASRCLTWPHSLTHNLLPSSDVLPKPKAHIAVEYMLRGVVRGRGRCLLDLMGKKKNVSVTPVIDPFHWPMDA